MKNLKKSQLILIAALAIVVVAFVVYRITVRPPSEDLSPEARVAAILDKGGCLDCHSANPDLPFYADMPVAGKLVQEDIKEAMMKVVAGPEKRSHLKNRKDLKETAIHEAGHAIAMYRLPTQDKVLHVTIIPRGRSLGATWHLPKDDTSNLTRNEMYEEIVSLLGGRVAEALFVGDISVGASNDIDRATKLAKDMVARYGMCEKLGTVSYLGGDELFIGRDYQSTKGYSEKVAATMDDEVKILIDKAYAHCKQILEENADKLHEVVAFLLENESMTGAQFADCMEGIEIRTDADVTLFDSFKEE